MKRINWLPGLAILLAGILGLAGLIIKAATWNIWPVSVVRTVDEILNFYRLSSIELALGLTIFGLVLALLGFGRYMFLQLRENNRSWDFTALVLGLLAFLTLIFSGFLEMSLSLAAKTGPIFLAGVLLREKKFFTRLGGILAGFSTLIFAATLGLFLAGPEGLVGQLKILQQVTFYLVFICWGLSIWRLPAPAGAIPEIKEKKPVVRKEKPVKMPKNKEQAGKKRGFSFPFIKRRPLAPAGTPVDFPVPSPSEPAPAAADNKKITWKPGAGDSDQVFEIKNTLSDSPEAIPED